MSTNNYTPIFLNLKDPNLNFYDVEEKLINNIATIVCHADLINKPENCPHCGGIHINIHGYMYSTVKLMPISGMNALLGLKKQRYVCKDCGKTFIAKTNIVQKNCYISDNVKKAATLKATDKISEKDIAKQLNISHSTVNRVINSFHDTYKVNFHYLPETLCFDEFKSTKDAEGSMSFIYCDAKEHRIIDIVENRQLSYLRKYFSRYPKNVRNKVKYIVMDMYKPYISLAKELFPKAKIIMDKFHIINNLSRALNKTRIAIMKRNDKLYNKLKNYYKLLLKERYELDGIHFYKYRCFNRMISQVDIVNYLLEQDEELKNTYFIYQDFLSAIKQKDETRLKKLIQSEYEHISGYMKTALKTSKEYEEYIINSVKYGYTNGLIEGFNNKIKVIKRIAFGYRSFFNFRNRILIMCNLICIEKGCA